MQIVRVFFYHLFWHLPRPFLFHWVKIRYKNKFETQTIISMQDNLICLNQQRIQNQNNTLYLYHFTRISRYFIGIQQRLNQIGFEYLLDKLPPYFAQNKSLIIDVGSNIGEFTMIASQIFPKAEFLRFEPEVEENQASKLNLKEIPNVLIESALWSESQDIKMYRDNRHGDTSLIRHKLFIPSRKTKSIKLDDVLTEMHFSQNHLIFLKCEAEGAEPEVLRGAANSLPRINYIVVDGGPERGLLKSSTEDRCSEFLSKYGFRAVASNSHGRKSSLYSNVKLNKT